MNQRVAAGGGAALLLAALALAAPAPQEPKELAVLQGHRGGAVCVAFSPDGKLLASAGGTDNTARLWDVATGKCLAVLEDHREYVAVVAFSPDSKTLASGGGDSTIRLWDTASGKPLAVLPDVKRAPVMDLAFSPDGKSLASGGSSGFVTLWDLGTNNALKTLPSGNSVIRRGSLAFTKEGTLLTVATWGVERPGVVAVLDFATEKELSRFKAHERVASGVAFSPDRLTLATVESNQVRLWDVSTGKAKASFEFPGPVDWIHTLAFSPSGKSLAFGSKDFKSRSGQIHLLDIASGKEFATITGHEGSVGCGPFSSDGRTLATNVSQGPIRLWSIPVR